MAKKKTPQAEPASVNLSLTKDEMDCFSALQLARDKISSELQKLDLMQENIFLKASIRLKMDLTNWGVDMKTRTFVPKPPELRETDLK